MDVDNTNSVEESGLSFYLKNVSKFNLGLAFSERYQAISLSDNPRVVKLETEARVPEFLDTRLFTARVHISQTMPKTTLCFL